MTGSLAPHEPWEVDDEDKDFLSSGAVLSGAVSGSGSARLCRGLGEGAFGDTTTLGSAAQSLFVCLFVCPCLHARESNRNYLKDRGAASSLTARHASHGMRSR